MSDAQDSRVGSMFGPYHPGRGRGARRQRRHRGLLFGVPGPSGPDG